MFELLPEEIKKQKIIQQPLTNQRIIDDKFSKEVYNEYLILYSQMIDRSKTRNYMIKFFIPIERIEDFFYHHTQNSKSN